MKNKINYNSTKKRENNKNNNFINLGVSIIIQLLILEIVFIFLEIFGIVDISYYISLELFVLIVGILTVYFLNKVFWNKKYYFLSSIFFSLFFLVCLGLSFFITIFNDFKTVFLINFLIFSSLLFIKKENNSKFNWKSEIKFIFEILLICYLLLLVLNEFILITFLNLNYFLGLVIVFGILSVIYEDKTKQTEIVEKKDYFLGIILGIIGGILIFIKTKELEWLSYVISIISGILIMLVSFMILEDDEEEK